MFDKSSDSDKMKLGNEVYTDPAGVGYNPEDTEDVLDGCNNPARNPGGETAPVMFTTAVLWRHLEPVDLDTAKYASKEFQLEYLEAVLNGNIPAGVNVDELRDRVIGCLPDGSASKTNLQADVEPICRCEADILFGRYTTISREDWLASKDHYLAAQVKGKK